jgi:tetratricopeptide (TPR) repeat protein
MKAAGRLIELRNDVNPIPTRNRLDPHYVKAYYRRGSAHYALGKYKDALKDFRQVVKVRTVVDSFMLYFASCPIRLS